MAAQTTSSKQWRQQQLEKGMVGRAVIIGGDGEKEMGEKGGAYMFSWEGMRLCGPLQTWARSYRGENCCNYNVLQFNTEGKIPIPTPHPRSGREAMLSAERRAGRASLFTLFPNGSSQCSIARRKSNTFPIKNSTDCFTVHLYCP